MRCYVVGILRVLVCIVLALAIGPHGACGTYYVAPDGLDSSPGTALFPWRTLTKADLVASPGDTVYVTQGDYRTLDGGVNRDIWNSGASGAPRLFKAVGNVNLIGSDSSWSCAFRIMGSYNILDGFKVKRGQLLSLWLYAGSAGNIVRNSRFSDETPGLNGEAIMVEGAGHLLHNNVIGPNYPDCAQGILDAGQNNQFLNNTIVGLSTGWGVEANTASTGATFRNNIIYNCAGGIKTTGAQFEHSHNILYGCATRYQGTSPAQSELFIDPLFANPGLGCYVPSDGSPAIDAGIDVGLPFNGTTPDIGAYETKNDATARVLGRLTDAATGHAIVGAVVAAGTAIVASDMQGEYSLDLAPGTYTITVGHPEYVSPDASPVNLAPHTLQVVNFSLQASTSGRTYCIATTGADTNPGTSAQPFLTFTKAASVASVGDTVVVRAGTYYQAPSIGCSGTASRPVTFKADPGVKVNLTSYTFAVTGNYVVIDGFRLNGGSVSVSSGRNSVGVEIKNCWLSGSKLYCGGGSLHRVHHNLIGPGLGSSHGIEDVSSGSRYCNNTIVDAPSGWGFVARDSGGDIEFENNIVDGTIGGIFADNPKLVHSHNIFHGVTYQYNNTTAGVAESIDDPVFVNPSGGDYTLASGSPAIDSGILVGLPFNGDWPDIGAYEYSGAPGSLGWVAGRITDKATGLGLAEAEVRAGQNSNTSTMADDQGYYRIEVATGPRVLTAECPSYLDSSKTINVAPGANATDFVLESGSVLSWVEDVLCPIGGPMPWQSLPPGKTLEGTLEAFRPEVVEGSQLAYLTSNPLCPRNSAGGIEYDFAWLTSDHQYPPWIPFFGETWQPNEDCGVEVSSTGQIMNIDSPDYGPIAYECHNSPKWHAIHKSSVLDIARNPVYSLIRQDNIGVPAGIHADVGGWCKWCMAGYKERLGNLFTSVQLQQMGITDLSTWDASAYLHSRLASGMSSWLEDRLVREYIRFMFKSNMEQWRGEVTGAHAIRADLPVCGNQVGAWNFTYPDVLLSDVGDLIFLENQRRAYPSEPNTSYYAVNLAAGRHAKPAWVWGFGFPEYGQRVEESRLFIAECYASGTVPCYLPGSISADVYDALSVYALFAQAHKELITKSYKADARVGLVYSVPSFLPKFLGAFNNMYNSYQSRQLNHLLGFARYMEKNHLPYNVEIMGDEEFWPDKDLAQRLAGYDVVICPNVDAISDAQAQVLRESVAGGKALIISGDLGVRDEQFTKRSPGFLSYLTGSMVFRVGEAPVNYQQYGNAGVLPSVFSSSLGADGSNVMTSAPATVYIRPVRHGDRMVVHLLNLNYDSGLQLVRFAGSIQLSIRLPASRHTLRGDVKFASAEASGPDAVLSSQVIDGRLVVQVPQWRIWGMVYFDVPALIVVETLGGLKSLPDDSVINLQSAIVTAGSGIFANNVIYVEDQNRTAGVKVISSASLPSVSVGARVSVEGLLTTTSDGERAVKASRITVLSAQ